MKSFFKKLFLGGEVLEKTDSLINGEILVTEDLFGSKEIKAGGVTQSGGLVKKLWEQILNFPYFAKHGWALQGKQCLILGLGGGTVARLILEKWPKTRMVGIELDPIMVNIGKKHFKLNNVKNLEIIIGDAIQYVKSQKSRFNLIVVDLYLGKKVPGGSESNNFLINLGKILAEDGMIIFNRLYYNREQQEKAEKLLAAARNLFPRVETRKAATNLLIFCR